MLDPFSSTRYQPATISSADEDARGIGQGTSIQTVKNLLAVEHPLQTYRTMRLIAAQIVLLTHPVDSRMKVLGEMTLDMLHPENTMIPARRSLDLDQTAVNTVIDELVVRAFLAALIQIGEPTHTDICVPWTNPVREPPTSTPARAELLQSMSSNWISGYGFSEINDMFDMSGPDLLLADNLDRNYNWHTALLPCFMPTDRIKAGLASATSGNTAGHYNTSVIPLAWNWNPSTIDMRASRDFDVRPHEVQASYASQYDPRNPCWVGALSGTRKFSIRFHKDQEPAPPVWEYAVLETIGYQHPLMGRRVLGSSPFHMSARLLEDTIIGRYHRKRLPFETDTLRWHGADAAMAAFAMGMSRGDAADYLITTARGLDRQPWVEVTPDQAFNARMVEEWTRTIDHYGMFAALSSGLRYVVSSILTYHIAGLSWDPERDIRNPLPVPTIEHMELIDVAARKKSKRGRKGTPWQHQPRIDVHETERRGNPVSLHSLNKSFFHDGITRGDLSLAKNLVLPGAVEALTRMVSGCADGEYGPVCKNWIGLALERTATLLPVQEQMLRHWIRTYEKAIGTREEQERAAQAARERGKSRGPWPYPAAARVVADAGYAAQTDLSPTAMVETLSRLNVSLSHGRGPATAAVRRLITAHSQWRQDDMDGIPLEQRLQRKKKSGR
ncbi:MAG: hypothetical protein ACK5MY_02700 [Jhaorihella sp.]